MNNEDAVKVLIERYRLEQKDYYVNYATGDRIISGNGIRRMIFIESMDIVKRLEHISADGKTVVAHCSATKDGVVYQALGEASPENNTFKYPVNVAEKRAEARAVLNRLGYYAQGWRGEDEIDDKVEGAKIAEKRNLQAKSATEATEQKIATPKTKRKALTVGEKAVKPADNIQADA